MEDVLIYRYPLLFIPYLCIVQIENLRTHLFPLLEYADSSLNRLHLHSQQHVVRHPSLLAHLSLAAGHAIGKNADTLTDMIVDDLMEDTVQLMNQLEKQQARDKIKQNQVHHDNTSADTTPDQVKKRGMEREIRGLTPHTCEDMNVRYCVSRTPHVVFSVVC